MSATLTQQSFDKQVAAIPSNQNIVLPMGIEDIMKRIPHRPPFLLIDCVTDIEPGKWIRGYKNVTMNEWFFQGHFPGRPIMPGVLILEAIAQGGAILTSTLPQAQNKLSLFAGIDNTRFKRQVVPGDRLDIYGEFTKLRDVLGKAACTVHVNGQLVVECDLMFSFVPDTRDQSLL